MDPGGGGDGRFTPVGTPITTPEKDKGMDVEQFGNEQVRQDRIKTPSPTHLYTPRPYSPYSSGTSVSPVRIEPRQERSTPPPPPTRIETSPRITYSPPQLTELGSSPSRGSRFMSSIFSQPGYTTSFMTKPVSPILGEGEQDRSTGSDMYGIRGRSPHHDSNQPLSTSTPMSSFGSSSPRPGPGGDYGSHQQRADDYTTPIRNPQSASMITHPGTTGDRTKTRSESESEDTIHSSSSDDYTDVVEKLGKGKNKKGRGRNKGLGMVLENKAATAPKIVKTTTKQTVVKDAEGVRHDVCEKIEDLTPGGSGLVTVSTTTKEVGYFKRIAWRLS